MKFFLAFLCGYTGTLSIVAFCIETPLIPSDTLVELQKLKEIQNELHIDRFGNIYRTIPGLKITRKL